MAEGGQAKYRPYPAYKPTGVEWLESIPEAWEPVYGKRLFSNRREASLPTDEQLAASQAFGVVPQSLMIERNNAKVMLALKGTQSFRHVEKDDFVISLRSFEGGIEHSAYTGCVSPAYTVLRPNWDIKAEFFRYLLKSGQFVSALQSKTDSLRDGKSITFQQFGGILLGLPTIPEQTKIAAFLDHETAKIDGLIAKQQRLIALLEEKRQAVISHAVTKGLDPTAPLRPSGIDWLGDVPAHWEVKRVKQVAKLESGHTPDKKIPAYWENCDISWVSLNDTTQLKKVDYISNTAQNLNLKGIANSSARLLPERSVVFTRDASIGLAAITTKPMAVSQHVIAWLCDLQKMCPEYLLFTFYAMKDELERYTFGATLKTIGMPDVNKLTCTVPPLAEQKVIIEHLFKSKDRLDTAISKAQSAITLLKERRTALISAAVTGKIDLRDWQPPEGTQTHSTQNIDQPQEALA